MAKYKDNIDPSILDEDTDSGAYTPRTSREREKITEDAKEERKSEKVRTEKGQSEVVSDGDEEETMGFWNSVVNFFTDRRLHITIGVFLLLATAYIAVACISYLAGDGEKDMSQVSTLPLQEQTQNTNNTENTAGPFGAVIGQVLITNSFGISIFVFIIYVLIISGAILLRKKIPFWELTFKSLLFVTVISIITSTFTYRSESPVLYGGQLGRMVVDTLTKYGGFIAAQGVSLFLFLVVIILYFNPISKFCSFIADKLSAILPKKKEPVEQDDTTEDDINDEGNGESISDTNDEDENDTNTDSDIAEEELSNGDGGDNYAESNGETDSEEEPSSTETTEEQGHIEENEPILEVKTPVMEMAEHTGLEQPYDPTAELSRYKFPPLDILKQYDTSKVQNDIEEQEENKARISQALEQYGIRIQKIDATVGPTITLYEIVPAEGVRIQQIKNLENDLMLNLAATGIRIIAPMPGRGTIGIEVPNKDPQIVSIRSILSSKAFHEFKGELPMAVGATISNEVYIADLAKMPHLLVAGATGQGKSVGMNTIIASLLYKKHPATLKFVLIDPKFVEFSLYSKLERHYLAKLPEMDDSIITTPDNAVATLNSLCIEMDNRYALLRDAGCRAIKEYNQKFIERRLNMEKGHRYLPYIVVIVDEFADIIAQAGKDIELPISRITAKARAVGIHMILSTQRPSTNVITGTIKANVPSRIAFKVSQMIDSRTIIDAAGAQHLIGRGDMLILNAGKTDRVQCALIETEEVEAICGFIDGQVGYDHAYFLPDYNPNDSGTGNTGAVSDRDSLFEDAARAAVMSKNGISASSLQRRFRIGYNRASNLIDQLEAAGIIGQPNGAKPRQILMDEITLEMFLESLR